MVPFVKGCVTHPAAGPFVASQLGNLTRVCHLTLNKFSHLSPYRVAPRSFRHNPAADELFQRPAGIVLPSSLVMYPAFPFLRGWCEVASECRRRRHRRHPVSGFYTNNLRIFASSTGTPGVLFCFLVYERRVPPRRPADNIAPYTGTGVPLMLMMMPPVKATQSGPATQNGQHLWCFCRARFAYFCAVDTPPPLVAAVLAV